MYFRRGTAFTKLLLVLDALPKDPAQGRSKHDTLRTIGLIQTSLKSPQLAGSYAERKHYEAERAVL